MSKKIKVIQLMPTISYGDAVSNDALALKEVIQEMGFKTQIYAENIDLRLNANVAENVKRMPILNDDDVIIYHASTGTKYNYELPKINGRKVMIYHNITPYHFFAGYSDAAFKLTKNGIDGIRYLKDRIDYCIADSKYNKEDLISMGYTCPIRVCPIIIPFHEYNKEPNSEVLRKYSDEDYTNILFVGRIAPNKKQEDIIRAFYCYRKRYNAKSRLFLVGSSTGMDAYDQKLKSYVAALGIQENVIFTGSIAFDEILSYYRLADIFVCMSEHEGFCVPLVEAMYFKIPIIAYASSAVPETLGRGGVLVNEKTPEFTAALIDRILNDIRFRSYIISEQNKAIERYRYSNVKESLVQYVNEIIR